MMTPRQFLPLLLIFLLIAGGLFFPTTAFAQPQPEIQHSFYLLGNTAGIDPNSAVLRHLETAINAEEHLFSVLYLGDIVSPEGLSETVSDVEQGRLRRLMHIANGNDRGNVYFLPGDRDWNNSGPEGRERARRLEKLIEDELDYKGVFLPGKGCPGPKVLDLNEQVRVVVINTQWWLHPYDRPEAPETECDVLTEHDFWEEIENVVEESDGKSLIFAAHHPMYSKGQYAGRRLLKKHLFPLTDENPNLYIPLPLIGSFYAGYRQNIGTPADMANEKYKAFRYKLYSLLREQQSLVYVSGHEFDLEAHILDNSFHINSGAAASARPVGKSGRTLFKKATTGYAKLVYYNDGSVKLAFYGRKKGAIQLLDEQQIFASACAAPGSKSSNRPRKGSDEPEESVVHARGSDFPPVNLRYIPCQEEIVAAATMNPAFRDSIGSTVGGAEYKSGAIKRLFLGKHYRDSWTAPLSIPYLDLDRARGGLEAFAKGGGRQTLSIKFTAKDGGEYVFRSVNKNPAKAVPPELRETVLLDLLKDQTTTQHPYGALVTDKLMNAAGILHAHPELFLLPDDPKLGPFQEEFAYLFGMLEERPKGHNKVTKAFADADRVLRSVQLFRELYEDNDHSVDPEAFAKARLFDIMIGDWGRHEDNWKWAGYKREDDEVVYYPIPRDRDHSFSRWDGILPWLADREWLRPNTENFDDKYHNIKNLTWPARHLDRRLLTTLGWADFERIAGVLKSEMTDAVIDEAVAQLPGDVKQISGPEIAYKLKARRDMLLFAARKYYDLLARQVDVVGSNKYELFEVERLNDGKVRVQVYKLTKNKQKQDKLLFTRTFDPAETQEIRLYGLGSEDQFEISGACSNSILIRIIGGDGKDVIRDYASVKGGSKMTRIYDSAAEDEIAQSTEAKILKPDPAIAYDPTAFAYNTYFPLPLLTFSADDGFGVGLSVGFTNYAFGKPDFASKHTVKALVTTNGSFGLGYDGRWRHVVGKWDLGVSGTFDFPDQSYPHFYGLGNGTTKSDSLFNANYYRLILRQLIGQLSLDRTFWRKSNFGLRLSYLRNSARKQDGVSGIFDEIPDLYGFDVNTLLGGGATLDIDFRDGSAFSTRGIRLFVRHDSYLNLTGEEQDMFGNTEAILSWYGTAKIGLPITLALTGGYADTYGRAPFFKLNTLGRNYYLRGYFRNRFSGNTAAHLNGELRFHMGTLSTPVVPLNVGLIGFYDQGRVWQDGAENEVNTWHSAYGGGIYLAPLSRDYTFRFDMAWSDEESLFFQFGMGLFLR